MVSASQVISGRENGIRRSAARPRSWPVGVLRACSLSLSLRFTQGFERQFTQNCQNCVTHNIANGKNLFFIFLFYVVVCTRLVLGLVHWNASVFWTLGWCSSMETWCVSHLLLLYAETLQNSHLWAKMPSLCRLLPTNSNKWFQHCEPFKHFFEMKQRCKSVKTTMINWKLGGAPSETITQRADEILMCENICGTRVAILHSLLLNQAVMLIV